MTTQQAVVPRNRRPRGQHPKPRDPDGRRRSTKKLPEYLEAHQVEALIRAAPNPRARLLFLIEWRAGLRTSEALALEVRDLSLEGELPSLHVREGKGSKPRIVPVHPELRAALSSALEFGDVGQGDRLIRASRATADRWIKAAAAKARELGVIPPGRRISNHTLRHSYARHLLAARQADQLRVSLAGSRLDTPDADLPGAGAGPDREPGVGAVEDSEFAGSTAVISPIRHRYFSPKRVLNRR